MKPTTATLGLAMMIAGLATSAMGADEAQPAPKPVKHGGYGSSASGPAPAPAPAVVKFPSRAPDPGTDWMAAAQAQLNAAVDELTQRSAAADRTWAGIGEKVDAQVRALMAQAGYSAAEMQACYDTSRWPKLDTDFYRVFYSNASEAVTLVNLHRIANPPIFVGRDEPIAKDGNRAAVAAAMAALDEEMGLFRYYDDVLQQQLAVSFDNEALRRFLGAEQDRTDAQVAEAVKAGDPGAYDDAANTAARAALRPLRAKQDRLRNRRDSAIDPRLAGTDIDLIIIRLPIFAGFHRLATQQDDPLAVRTDKIVPLTEVARRMETQIQTLGTRSNEVYTLPAFQQWNIDPLPYLKVYRRQVVAIAASLHRWFQRGGATEADLARIDAAMGASLRADQDFNAIIRQQATYQQQLTALESRSADLGGEIDELDRKAGQLRGSGDYPGAYALDAQAEPLRQQKSQLDATHDQLYNSNSDLYRKSVADADALVFVEATPSGRVIAVRFELATENEPDKSVVPQFPLKGAPVTLSLTRQITDITLGIPFSVEVDWEQEEGTAPEEQTLTLIIGGKSVPLTLHLNSNQSRYTSGRVVFLAPPATPKSPLVQP